MKKLDQIKYEAEKELIDRLSDRCLEVLLEGGDFRLERGELEDDWHAIKDEVADYYTPREDDDVRSILNESGEQIEETFNFIKDEIDPTFGKDVDQYIPMIKSVIFYNIANDFDFNAHNIFWKTTDETIRKLKLNFDTDLLDNKDYILSYINECNHGYPLIVASDNLKDDPEVVKKAIEKESWLFDYSSLRLFNISKNSPVNELLEKDMLKNKLKDELINNKNKSIRKNKI